MNVPLHFPYFTIVYFKISSASRLKKVFFFITYLLFYKTLTYIIRLSLAVCPHIIYQLIAVVDDPLNNAVIEDFKNLLCQVNSV